MIYQNAPGQIFTQMSQETKLDFDDFFFCSNKDDIIYSVISAWNFVGSQWQFWKKCPWQFSVEKIARDNTVALLALWYPWERRSARHNFSRSVPDITNIIIGISLTEIHSKIRKNVPKIDGNIIKFRFIIYVNTFFDSYTKMILLQYFLLFSTYPWEQSKFDGVRGYEDEVQWLRSLMKAFRWEIRPSGLLFLLGLL